MANIAVIGLGEAGAAYSTALATAGHHVWGVDPADVSTPVGVQRAEAVPTTGIDAVLVITSARVAGILATELLPALPEGSIWVDMTTATPQQKLEAVTINPAVSCVDVAILGPVIMQGINTPLLLAGPEAARVADLLHTIDAPVEIVEDGQPGDAMAHKFLRSVLMKGLAAVVTEAVTAGKAAGREAWIRDQVAAQLAGDGYAVMDRLLTGSVKHAARRADEMIAVSEYLSQLGVDADVSNAAHTQLNNLKG